MSSLQDQLASLRAELSAESSRLETEWKASEETRLASLATAQATLEGARQADKEARAALDDAEATLHGLRESHDALLAGQSRRADWQEAKARLGSEPEKADAPQPFDGIVPTAQEVEIARETIRCADVDEGTVSAQEQTLLRARERLEDCQRVAKEKAAEWERLDGLLADARLAPSALVPRAIEAMGDLGPCQVRLVGEGVEIWGSDGLGNVLPFHVLSGGRRLVIDAHLRMGLRRAAGLGALPIVVDQAQDWSGEWPEMGPSIVLVTKQGA